VTPQLNSQQGGRRSLTQLCEARSHCAPQGVRVEKHCGPIAAPPVPCAQTRRACCTIERWCSRVGIRQRTRRTICVWTSDAPRSGRGEHVGSTALLTRAGCCSARHRWRGRRHASHRHTAKRLTARDIASERVESNHAGAHDLKDTAFLALRRFPTPVSW